MEEGTFELESEHPHQQRASSCMAIALKNIALISSQNLPVVDFHTEDPMNHISSIHTLILSHSTLTLGLATQLALTNGTSMVQAEA